MRFRSNVLTEAMSATRASIQECIQTNPGIHFSEIRRTLDIATGQTQYHLRKLRRNDRVHREEICGRTHFYPPTYTPWERGVIALLRRETSREIIVFLLRQETASPETIAKRLDLARSTVEWHLSNLVEYDIVTKQTTDDGSVVVELTDRSDIYRQLREIEPRLTDRLVDRFTRLTDSLLAD
jgi:predicted transcriptional regulator